MKELYLLIIGLLFCNIMLAQTNAIKITNVNSKKEKIIKENKRVRVKTVDGRKISGRFSIEGNLIALNNEQFELNSIAEIKRNPLLTSILTSGFLIYGGAIVAGFGVLIGVLADSTAFWLTIPAAGMIYAGIKSPNFNKKYKNDGNWIFELITISD